MVTDAFLRDVQVPDLLPGTGSKGEVRLEGPGAAVVFLVLLCMLCSLPR